MKNIVYHLLLLFEGLIRNISGGIGIKIRYLYYRKRFYKCGYNIRISENVFFENCCSIELGNNISILQNTFISGPSALPKNRIIKSKAKRLKTLIIGDETSIGSFNIINGGGSLKIGSKVTTSAYVSIYSHSHLPYLSDRNEIVYANAMVQNDKIACIDTQIVLEDGVWLGLNVKVFQGSIGTNTFVKTNSVVTNDLKRNSVYEGNPATFKENRFNAK